MLNLVEYRASELTRQTGTRTKDVSKACYVSFDKFDKDELTFNYTVACDGGEPSGYDVEIAFNKELTLAKDVSDINKWHVNVKCECPAWCFWGSNYLAVKNFYLNGEPECPVELPKRNLKYTTGHSWQTSKICKHAYVAMLDFMQRAPKYSKQIKSIMDKEEK